MSLLIYQELANDKLGLLAEVEGESNVELAVDLLLDSDPKLAHKQPFVVFDADARQVVEVGEEIVQPRRKVTIKGGSNNSTTTSRRRGRPRSKPAPEVAEVEVEADAKPKRQTRTTKKPAAPARKVASKRSTARSTRKPAAKAPAAKASTAKASGIPKARGGFKRNPASDE